MRDDGIGLGQPAAALQRGNGLGGMQERVWAHAGQWRILPGTAAWPGLALQAWLPLNPPHDAPCPS